MGIKVGACPQQEYTSNNCGLYSAWCVTALHKDEAWVGARHEKLPSTFQRETIVRFILERVETNSTDKVKLLTDIHDAHDRPSNPVDFARYAHDSLDSPPVTSYDLEVGTEHSVDSVSLVDSVRYAHDSLGSPSLVDASEPPGSLWDSNRLPDKLDLTRPVDMHAEGTKYAKVKDRLSDHQLLCFAKTVYTAV
jgi:hypothetical protein